MPKSTAAEVSIRVQEVENQILVGKTRHEILRYATKWTVGSEMVDEYIQKARRNIQEINSATLEENRSNVLRCLWDLYQKASEVIEVEIRNKEGEVIATIKKMRSPTEARKNLEQISSICGLEELTVRHVRDPLPEADEFSMRAELEDRNSASIN